MAGELSRLVFTDKSGHPDSEMTVRRSARAGREYWLHAACTSAAAGRTPSVELRSGRPGASDDALAAVDIPCDGAATVNGLGTLPAEPVMVGLRGAVSGVSSAYAVVAPTPVLAEQRAEGVAIR